MTGWEMCEYAVSPPGQARLEDIKSKLFPDPLAGGDISRLRHLAKIHRGGGLVFLHCPHPSQVELIQVAFVFPFQSTQIFLY
jgi:hypothetical protein